MRQCVQSLAITRGRSLKRVTTPCQNIKLVFHRPASATAAAWHLCATAVRSKHSQSARPCFTMVPAPNTVVRNTLYIAANIISIHHTTLDAFFQKFVLAPFLSSSKQLHTQASNMALTAGELYLTLEFAQGLKDKDFFGKQDPYAIVSIGNQQYRSKTHTDGGRNPVWSQTFNFNIINEVSRQMARNYALKRSHYHPDVSLCLSEYCGGQYLRRRQLV